MGVAKAMPSTLRGFNASHFYKNYAQRLGEMKQDTIETYFNKKEEPQKENKSKNINRKPLTSKPLKSKARGLKNDRYRAVSVKKNSLERDF